MPRSDHDPSPAARTGLGRSTPAARRRAGPDRLKDRLADQRRLLELTADAGDRSRAIRANLDDLIGRADAVQQDVIAVCDWAGWLRLPWRAALFDKFCRYVTPAEWERAAADDAFVPWIFGPYPPEFAEHLDHCPHCRLQRLAGAIRGRHKQNGFPLYGDHQVAEFLAAHCRQALYAAQLPPDGEGWSSAAGVGDSPIELLPRAPARPGDPIRVVLRGEGEQVHLRVVAEFVHQEHGLRDRAPVFPSAQPGDVVKVGGEIELRPWPAATAGPGRIYLRYQTRSVEFGIPAGVVLSFRGSSPTADGGPPAGYGIGTTTLDVTGA